VYLYTGNDAIDLSFPVEKVESSELPLSGIVI